MVLTPFFCSCSNVSIRSFSIFSSEKLKILTKLRGMEIIHTNKRRYKFIKFRRWEKLCKLAHIFFQFPKNVTFVHTYHISCNKFSVRLLLLFNPRKRLGRVTKVGQWLGTFIFEKFRHQVILAYKIFSSLALNLLPNVGVDLGQFNIYKKY